MKSPMLEDSSRGDFKQTSPCIDRNGKRPGSAFGFRAGRAMAGDRPPRYGALRFSCCRTALLHRRARACPSPCFGPSDVRGGQAPALRYLDIFRILIFQPTCPFEASGDMLVEPRLVPQFIGMAEGGIHHAPLAVGMTPAESIIVVLAVTA